MKKLNDQHQSNEQDVNFEPEGDTLVEHIFRTVIEGYRDAYNKVSTKQEIDFFISITNHKVATPEGNKDVAYLRLDKATREKKFNEAGEVIEQGEDEGWEMQLLHQEVHFFRNIQERLNPDAPWKEDLYTRALARLISAGLEYAEVLKLWKKKEAKKNLTEDERLNKLGLVKATEQPAPLTKDDEEYKKWLKEERDKAGL